MELIKLVKAKTVILLTGETGTGKSQLAKKIHFLSDRKNKKFLQVNVCSIAENLFESELFGHAKGAFTGAHEDKDGFLDSVNGGTLFLDEIGELSLSLQAKLLMLLEERTYYAVGSTRQKKFEGVIILATHKDLEKEVIEKQFREDLYFRIRYFHKKLMPLRFETKVKDIITKQWEELCIDQNLNKALTQSVVERLSLYRWPGNYRELKNTLEYIFLNSHEIITNDDIPEWVKDNKINIKSDDFVTDDFYQNIEIFEKMFLSKMFEKYKGRLNLTSEKINLNKVTLITKMKKYGITSGDLKVSN
jgi:transcriptional regulator with PAS, ATPase and Fis domain